MLQQTVVTSPSLNLFGHTELLEGKCITNNNKLIVPWSRAMPSSLAKTHVSFSSDATDGGVCRKTETKCARANLSKSASPNNGEQLKVIHADFVPFKSHVLSFLSLQVFY